MEGDRVDTIQGAVVATNVRERSEEAVQVDRGEGRRGVGNGVVGERQATGEDTVDARVASGVLAGVLEVDPEGAGVVDAGAIDLNRLAGESDRQDALLSAAVPFFRRTS